VISFSPPDITQDEIDEVVDTLKSGWITTGPKTKRLEAGLGEFIGNESVCCLGSATAALEIGLRLLGIGPGDEVITSAYTYTASASCICHVGAKPVLVDTAPGSFEMDYAQVATKVTDRTRAIIPVDIGGRMVDYDALDAALRDAQGKWHPSNATQASFGRIPIIADGAHSLGAIRHGLNSGQAADLTAFSFHAVKNFTTAEGGALTWRDGTLEGPSTRKLVSLMALHGQSKDALEKDRAGAWEYDILFPGWKCNMTDIMAAIGLAQLRRYGTLLERRRQIVERYETGLANAGVTLMRHFEGDPATTGFASSAHLMLVRLDGHSRDFRDEMIRQLAAARIASNVHYKPLPLLTAYRNMGYNIADFPNAFAQFENEITLPLHTLLTDEDVDTVINAFLGAKARLEERGLA